MEASGSTGKIWNTNTKRVANRSALHALLDDAVSRLSADELTTRLDAAQIAHARMNDVASFVAHPQLDAADRWRTVPTEAGPMRALRPPIALDAEDSAMGAVPGLGEHTDAILSSLDVPAATIADWRARGLIR